MATFAATVLLQAATASLLLPDGQNFVSTSRRQALLHAAGAASLCFFPAAPSLADATGKGVLQFDEEGKLIEGQGVQEETSFRTVRAGAANAQLLDEWRWASPGDGSLSDPLSGQLALTLQFAALPTTAASITDLGKPENLPVVRALGLDPELERADMVAAALRTSGGTTFYEYDLALPATKCDAEMATVCLPSKIVLLSSCVRDATLHVIRVEADIRQWKLAGKALKRIRSSVAVDAAAPPRAPDADGEAAAVGAA